MEVAIAGWFVSPAFGKVLEKAQKYLGANYKLQKDTQDMFEELKRNLLFCQATVKEVDKRAIINNPPLQELLFHLKVAVLEAEYVLDNMKAKSIKEEGQGKNKVRRVVFPSCSTVRNIFFPDDNLKSLKMVVDNLKKLSTDIPTLLNLVNINKDNESHTHEVTDQRKTISQLFEEGLYFKELDVLDLMKYWTLFRYPFMCGLIASRIYLSSLIFTIGGMGWVGKTPVPHAVYNNPEVQQTFESKGSGGVRCPYWPSESKGSEGVRCPYWPLDKTQFDWESKPFDSEFPFLHSIEEFDGIPINHPFSFPIKSEFQFFHASLSLSFLFFALCERWRKLERILTAEMLSPHSPASPPPTPTTSTASSCSASSTPPTVNTTSTTPASAINSVSVI